MKIVSVGDIGIDYYENIQIKKPGGIAFNFAVNAVKNNIDCSLVSAIGEDWDGEKIKKLLQTLHFDISHLHQMKGKTAQQKINLKENGERVFVGYNPGVLSKWYLNKANINFILEHQIVYVPLSDGLEDIFDKIANLQGITKVVDLSQDYEFADFESKNNLITKYCINFDIIFIGGNENLIVQVKMLSTKYPKKLFILTLGNKGSFAFQNGKSYFQKAYKVNKVIDTTGCGDAFQAAFTVSYFANNNIKNALEFGSKQAASIASHVGSTENNL